ncbi:hypothetical protein D3C75_958130 [compost metagenome]
MAQRDQRFDAVLFALGENVAVESNPFHIRHRFVPVREKTGPGDRSTEYAEPHLCHQGNVIFIAMIKINADMAGIELILPQLKALFLAQFYRQPIFAMRDHINRGQPFAALKISAFGLVSR